MQAILIGLSVGLDIGLGLCQCKHTIKARKVPTFDSMGHWVPGMAVSQPYVYFWWRSNRFSDGLYKEPSQRRKFWLSQTKLGIIGLG